MKRKRECLRVLDNDTLQCLQRFLSLADRLRLAIALYLPKMHRWWKYSPLDGVLSWLNARFLPDYYPYTLTTGHKIGQFLGVQETAHFLYAVPFLYMSDFVKSKLPHSAIAPKLVQDHYAYHCINFKSSNSRYQLRISFHQGKAECRLLDQENYGPSYAADVHYNANALVQWVKNEIGNRRLEPIFK